MQQSIYVYYISLSGNTTSFLKRLKEYLIKEYQQNLIMTNIKELVKKSDYAPFEIKVPYIAFLPSYLKGGNGTDNGYTEILTTPFRRLIAYQANREQCLGIVGSGNRNFNKQFCLTAHQYAEEFHFPVLDEYELRGTKEDVTRIGNKIMSVLRK